MASTFYYYCLCIAAIAVGLYNFTTSSSGSGLVCWSNTTLTYDQYVEYNKSLNLSIEISDPLDNSITYDIPKSGSNILKILQIAIALGYAAVLVFTFILAILVGCFSNQLPEDYLQFGKCKNCLAMFCKILPILIVIFHWLLFILIVTNWIMIIMNQCIKTTTTVAGVLIIPTQYFLDSRLCLIVTSAIWFFLHYIGAILKDLSYVEPFMHNPKTEGSSGFVHIVLKKLGP